MVAIVLRQLLDETPQRDVASIGPDAGAREIAFFQLPQLGDQVGSQLHEFGDGLSAGLLAMTSIAVPGADVRRLAPGAILPQHLAHPQGMEIGVAVPDMPEVFGSGHRF
jgi:hypothetical protein